jgi:hypothetical protein
MPRIDQILENFRTAQFFSIIDCRKGYWQVKMASSSVEKTAFSTPFGHYQFRVMPFGLKGAPATFQQMIDEVLREYPQARAYFDDIILFSNTLAEHLRHLSEVLKRLNKANLKINTRKSRFGYAKVEYLGHTVGEGTISQY